MGRPTGSGGASRPRLRASHPRPKGKAKAKGTQARPQAKAENKRDKATPGKRKPAPAEAEEEASPGDGKPPSEAKEAPENDGRGKGPDRSVTPEDRPTNAFNRSWCAQGEDGFGSGKGGVSGELIALLGCWAVDLSEPKRWGATTVFLVALTDRATSAQFRTQASAQAVKTAPAGLYDLLISLSTKYIASSTHITGGWWGVIRATPRESIDACSVLGLATGGGGGYEDYLHVDPSFRGDTVLTDSMYLAFDAARLFLPELEKLLPPARPPTQPLHQPLKRRRLLGPLAGLASFVLTAFRGTDDAVSASRGKLVRPGQAIAVNVFPTALKVESGSGWFGPLPPSLLDSCGLMRVGPCRRIGHGSFLHGAGTGGTAAP
jgi:hypothetical protein